MSKPTTHVLMVIDMSGSMGPLAEDVRGGFNSYLDTLRVDADTDYHITVTLFDTETITLAVAEPLDRVPELDRTNYVPRGGTALLDAVGRTLAEFHLRVPELGDGDRVLVVVNTDGHENSSKEYQRDTIRDLIATREATGRWTFVFLGAGPDAWAQAGEMGFTRSVQTVNTAWGTRTSYAAAAGATVMYAAGATGQSVAGHIEHAVREGEQP